MEKVKVKNKKTGIVKEVNKNVASDFLGTKEWEIDNGKSKKYEIPENKYVNIKSKEQENA